MSEELRPCPFCGSDDIESIDANNNYHYMHCMKCGGDGTPDLGISGAIEMWNTRPIEDDLRAKLDIAIGWFDKIINCQVYPEDDEGTTLRYWAEEALKRLRQK